MKYIKKYESSNLNEIEKLVNHLIIFIRGDNDNINYTSYNGDYAFLYTISGVQNKYFMNVRLSTNKEYILFNIDTIIQNPGWINKYIEEISQFIKFIMDKYTELGRINISNVDNIINDVTKEKYEIYLNTLKYNL